MNPALKFTDAEPDPCTDLVPISASKLVKDNPKRFPVVIDGIIREKEIINLVAASKSKKSHMALDLAFSIATGTPWLGRSVKQGKVLYLDCELHAPTLAYRVVQIANERKLSEKSWGSTMMFMPMRGKIRNIYDLKLWFERIPPREYLVIILDALYRLVPAGSAENANGDMTNIYNCIDHYAYVIQSAFIVVHHSSKGDQSGKSITDVGSGAGAQARAVDNHIVLREHQEKDVMVMEAANRSFEPQAPVCIRWKYPVWNLDESIDPAGLKRNSKRDSRIKHAKPVKAPWTHEKFVTEFATVEPQDKGLIEAKARAAGIATGQIKDLIQLAVSSELLHRWEPDSPKKPLRYATSKQPELPTDDVS